MLNINQIPESIIDTKATFLKSSSLFRYGGTKYSSASPAKAYKLLIPLKNVVTTPFPKKWKHSTKIEIAYICKKYKYNTKKYNWHKYHATSYNCTKAKPITNYNSNNEEHYNKYDRCSSKIYYF